MPIGIYNELIKGNNKKDANKLIAFVLAGYSVHYQAAIIHEYYDLENPYITGDPKYFWFGPQKSKHELLLKIIKEQKPDTPGYCKE